MNHVDRAIIFFLVVAAVSIVGAAVIAVWFVATGRV